MIIVLCRDKAAERSWLIFGEDQSTPPLHWIARPDVDLDLCARLDGNLAGCFEAQWIRREGERVLSLGARLPLPVDIGHEDRCAVG